MTDERSLLSGDPPLKAAAGGIYVAFFCIGAGAVVTYNAVVMAVAYFRLDGGLGADALTQFCRWHNLCLVSIMCLILLSPRKPSLRWHVILLVVSYVFGAGFNTAILVVASLRSSLPSTLLYGLVAVNGGATGVACALGASLSGIFETYSLSRGVGVAQLRGAAFGIAVPTVVQMALLPMALLESDKLAEQTALAAALSAAAGLALCVTAAAATCRIAADDIFITHARKQQETDLDTNSEAWELCSNPANDTIGQCVAGTDTTRAFVWDRFTKVAPLAAAQFLNCFCLIMMLLYSPSLPIVGSKRDFWSAYFPTLAVAANNIFGYVGRSIPRPPPVHRASWPVAFVLVAPLGLIGIHLYRLNHARVQPLPKSNLTPLVFYALIAVLVGRATVVFSQVAQQVCGHTQEFACPIVAQMNFISIEGGALAGAFVSA